MVTAPQSGSTSSFNKINHLQPNRGLPAVGSQSGSDPLLKLTRRHPHHFAEGVTERGDA